MLVSTGTFEVQDTAPHSGRSCAVSTADRAIDLNFPRLTAS
jgi:hypothetical protein